jgi:hypothetical protein
VQIVDGLLPPQIIWPRRIVAKEADEDSSGSLCCAWVGWLFAMDRKKEEKAVDAR